MIFEGLSDKLQGALGKLKSKGKLTEKDVKDAMREVKLALLEADVNFKVVKDFIKKVQERCVGQDVMTSLTPAQHVIKIVNEELTSLMGDVQSKVMISSKPPTIIMMVGLQGAGKTTTSGKLGNYLKKQGKKPLLVACDVYRPAAIKQLQVVGEKLDIPVFNMGDKESPVNIAKAGLSHAIKNNHDLVIIDTAGRLHIDETLMDELKSIKSEVKPHEILLVVDSMTGQDAVNVSESFDEALGLDGVILRHGVSCVLENNSSCACTGSAACYEVEKLHSHNLSRELKSTLDGVIETDFVCVVLAASCPNAVAVKADIADIGKVDSHKSGFHLSISGSVNLNVKTISIRKLSVILNSHSSFLLYTFFKIGLSQSSKRNVSPPWLLKIFSLKSALRI